MGSWRRDRSRLGAVLSQHGRGRTPPVDAFAVGAGRRPDPQAQLAAADPADRGHPDGAGDAGHQAARYQPIDIGVNAAGTVVLFVLLTARMTGLAGQAARQQERERAISKVLEATQQERIRLAADLHDGPVQELTALSSGLERVDRRLQTQGPDAALELLGEQKNHLVGVTRTLRSLLSEGVRDARCARTLTGTRP